MLEKRTLRSTAAVLLLLAGLVAGSGSVSAAVEISYLTHWSGRQVTEMNRAIAAFEEENPEINIQLRTVPFGNLLTTLTTQARSSSGPTIVSIYDLWLPRLVRDGIVAPAPGPYVEDILGAYPEGVTDAVTVKGRVYGYPNEVDLYALNYNEALFEEAGISEPPTTWAELKAYAEKLTVYDSSGRIIQQGFGIINSWNSGVVHPWLSLLLSNGGRLISDDHKPLLDSQEAGETFELYHHLITVAETTDPAMGRANASTTGPYLNNFANGRTAMIIMANWWESSLKQAMGSNFENVATASIPVGPSGDAPHSVSYSWLTVVNSFAGDAQREAAWRFLKWFNGPESGQNGSSAMGDILMGMGILPSRTSDLQAHQDELDDSFIKTYVDTLDSAVPFPIVLGGAELTTALQKRIEALEFGIATVDQTIRGAQRDVSDILGRYYE